MDYAITYNPTSHMFDVLYQGAWIDSVPCYADGQSSIDLHATREAELRRAVGEADAAVQGEAADQPSARRCIHCGDPLVFGDVCRACEEDAGSAVLAA